MVHERDLLVIDSCGPSVAVRKERVAVVLFVAVCILGGVKAEDAANHEEDDEAADRVEDCFLLVWFCRE